MMAVVLSYTKLRSNYISVVLNVHSNHHRYDQYNIYLTFRNIKYKNDTLQVEKITA